MVATVIVNQHTGPAATVAKVNKTSGVVRFKNADNSDPSDTVNKMVIPASGSDFSFEAWLRMEITGGTFTQLENVKFYTDGAGFGTGIVVRAKTASTYPTNGPIEPTSAAGYTEIFASYQINTPLVIGSSVYTAVGEIGLFLVLIMEVQSTASPSSLTPETGTFTYDEV